VNRRTVIALAAASTLVATPAITALATTGGSTLVSSVPGLSAVHVAGATDLGAARDAAMHVEIVLAGHNEHELESLIVSGKTVSSATYDARYAATAAEAAVVTKWARAHGLTAQVRTGRTMVQIAGTTRTIGAAFGTTFHNFRQTDGTRYRGVVGAAHVPAAVAAVSSSIVGLTDFTLRLPHRSIATAPAAGSSPSARTLQLLNSFGPKDFWQIYHAGNSATGVGQNLAIITAGDISQAKADLPKFEDNFGLPHVPFNEIHVGPASSDASGATEWDLDSQYSTGFAPNVSSLTSYTATSLANTDILPTIAQWVTDNASRQASFSAGECEALAVATGFSSAVNAVLRRGSAQGQSLFVSSGDTGSQCPAVIGVNGVPAGVPGVEYPAASPWAIGVGGTTIYSTTPTGEVTWYATGGGIGIENAPAWQKTAGGTFDQGVNHRGVPDVAIDADPDTGYTCVINGAVTRGVGGTSAGAPAWQGIWARAQAAHGGHLGYAGPLLYKIPASSFHDIQVGTNGLYPASPGYDLTTGRGTPVISSVVGRA
jgi:pseudomonalisin